METIIIGLFALFLMSIPLACMVGYCLGNLSARYKHGIDRHRP